MHRLYTLGLLLSLACLYFVSARLPSSRSRSLIPPLPLTLALESTEVISRNGTKLPSLNTTYYFDQLKDHNNASLGTFKQRYWYNYQFYQPGGPIVLFTPGESDAKPYLLYLTNETICGLIAQQENGATIVLEHRYYGLSNPYPDLSVESLRLHTLEQAIEDLVYFAQTVTLPMPGGDHVTPLKAPWILVGGSYSGALVSWTMVNKPGVFFAGYASSAVVQAIDNFWKYFEPIREYMPANCSADVQAVIAHVDETFTGGNTTAIQILKESFGMGDVAYLDDVASALQANLFEWQDLQVFSGPGSQFYNFCDALEVKEGVLAPASGWGLDHALLAWGSYWHHFYYNYFCGNQTSEDCFGTHNPNSSIYTNISINNADRSWMWIVCNDVGWIQDSAPVGRPTLVSRLVQPGYTMRECDLAFPGTFKNNSMPRASYTNAKFKGWNVKVDRLFFATGKRDPWKEATMSARESPARSTLRQPIALSDGFHTTDMISVSAIDPTIAAVQNLALAFMKQWLQEWEAHSLTDMTTTLDGRIHAFLTGYIDMFRLIFTGSGLPSLFV